MYKDLFRFKDIHQKARYLIYSASPPSPAVIKPLLKKTAKVLTVAAAVTAGTVLLAKKINK